jgi:hypothetical protein
VFVATRASLRAAIAARPTLFAAGSYLLVAVAMLAPALSPGRTAVPADIVNLFSPWHLAVAHHHVHSPLTSDAGLQFYPWFDFLGDSVRDGHLPEWNPYLLGGVPFTPNGYVTSYYPPYLLAAVMDPRDAYTLFVALHLVIAAIGVYAFSRVLGVRPLAAWIGGLGAFTALYWVHWSLHLNHSSGMAWLPAVLAASEWAIMRPGRRSAAVLALVFALWWLGGGVQYTYYGSLALLAYVAFSLARRLRIDARAAARSLAALGAGLGLGVLLAAPLLLPTARISDTVVREVEPVRALTATHLPLVDTLLLVVPDARGNPVADVVYRGYPSWLLETPFVGVVALMLACVGVATVRRRHLALALGAGTVLLLGFTGWPHELLYDVVPGYDRFRNSSRWFAVLPAFALPLAALGADALLAGRRRARLALYAATAVAGAAILAYAGWVAADASSPKRFFAAVLAASLAPLAAVVAVALLAARRGALAVALLVGALLFETGVHSATWYPFVRESEAYPQLPFADAIEARGGRMIRVASGLTPLGPFPPDLPMTYGLTDAGGQDVLFPSVYDRYLRLIEDHGNYVSDTNTAPPLVDPRRLDSPLVRALDVRTAVVEQAVVMPAGFPRIASDGIDAYAVTSSLGPAVLVPDARPATDEEMWSRIADPTWDPAASAAVLGLARPVRGGRGTVTRLSSSDDRDAWRVVAPRGGLLRVSGNYDSGWKAAVDGRATPVLRADGIFRSVVVPAGTHEVRFAYTNSAERRGRIVGAAALVVVALLLLPARRRRRPAGAPA